MEKRRAVHVQQTVAPAPKLEVDNATFVTLDLRRSIINVKNVKLNTATFAMLQYHNAQHVNQDISWRRTNAYSAELTVDHAKVQRNALIASITISLMTVEHAQNARMPTARFALTLISVALVIRASTQARSCPTVQTHANPAMKAALPAATRKRARSARRENLWMALANVLTTVRIVTGPETENVTSASKDTLKAKGRVAREFV